MSNPNERVLAENEAMLIEYVEATMSPKHDRLIIRKWERIEATYIDELVRDLNLRTSMKNPPDKAMNYVVDPQTGDKSDDHGGRVFEGLWRGVSVRGEVINGVGTVFQTLAFGLVKSGEDLPDPELVGTEDSLFSPHGLIGDSERETREVRYRGIDPAYVETLKDTLTLATSNRIEAKSVRMADGSYNIHLLIETVSFTNTTPAYTVVRVEGKGSGRKKTTYRAPEVPVASAQAIVVALGATSDVINAWSEQGRDGEAVVFYTLASNSSVEEETRRTVEQCGLMPTVTRTWYDVAAGDIDTVYATALTYTGESGDVGYVTRDVDREIDDDGTATIRATAWKPQRLGLYIETDRRPVARGQIEQVTKTWYDVPNADIATIYIEAEAYTGESGDSGFTHKGATKSVDSFGCAIIQAIAFKPTRVGAIKETHRTSAIDGQLATVTRTYYGVKPADVDTVYTTAKAYIGESGDSGYVHKEADRVLHDDGYATIWCMAWVLPRRSTIVVTRRTNTWISGQRPSVKKTWYDVESANIASVWATAKLYKGETADIAFYVHKTATRDVADNGTAIITAEAWHADYASFVSDSIGNIKYDVVADISKTDSTLDTWRYKRTTYNIYWESSIATTLSKINGGLSGTSWGGWGRGLYQGIKVTRIAFSNEVYASENMDTNASGKGPADATY